MCQDCGEDSVSHTEITSTGLPIWIQADHFKFPMTELFSPRALTCLRRLLG